MGKTTVDKFTKVIIELDAAICEETKECGETYFWAKVARRAVGINTFLLDSRKGESYSDQLKVELRMQIHGAFGAPGDFGYSTPIGRALQKLYLLEIRPPGEPAPSRDTKYESRDTNLGGE